MDPGEPPHRGSREDRCRRLHAARTQAAAARGALRGRDVHGLRSGRRRQRARTVHGAAERRRPPAARVDGRPNRLMPDLEENAAYWDGGFHWRYGGDEWSRWWGTPEAQWRATIYPRIAEYLPVRRLVEIAPGYGRWTQFLRDSCDELVAIDLS